MLRRYVRSRNHVNEEALPHWRAVTKEREREREKGKNTDHGYVKFVRHLAKVSHCSHVLLMDLETISDRKFIGRLSFKFLLNLMFLAPAIHHCRTVNETKVALELSRCLQAELDLFRTLFTISNFKIFT